MKTTVGFALKQLFTDNIAFTIAAFFGGRPRGKRGGLQATMCNTLRKNYEREEGDIFTLLQESKV